MSGRLRAGLLILCAPSSGCGDDGPTDPTGSGTATVTPWGAGPQPLSFVVVPAGSFAMGDGNTDSCCGSNVYPVTLAEGFLPGEAEVTSRQDLELLQWAHDRATWRRHEADPYRAAGYRLPADAEREYATQYDDEHIAAASSGRSASGWPGR